METHSPFLHFFGVENCNAFVGHMYVLCKTYNNLSKYAKPDHSYINSLFLSELWKASKRYFGLP